MRNLVVNGETYVMRTENTTIASIKKVIGSILRVRKIDKKDAVITLPDGKVISFRDLDIIKDIVVRMNAGTYAGVDIDDTCADEARQLDWMVQQTYRTPVAFSKLGSDKKADFIEIATATQARIEMLDNAPTLSIGLIPQSTTNE